MIERIKERIDASLKGFLQKVRREYKFSRVDPILFESIREFTLRPGKRIRPLLLILSYLGYTKSKNQPSRELYNASSCIELLHNFMLIHDDIIDQSDLRRGRPTMHRLLEKAAASGNREKLGYDLGIVAGDIVYALAIDAFLTIPESPRRKEEALKYFIKTAAFTAMGEFIDVLSGVKKIKEVSEKDVFLNYSLKTARYTFECPLVIGAILAGADKTDIEKLSRLGVAVGQAFQIQDDILGIFASQKSIGKSILSDIAESKKTILVCHAFKRLKGKRRARFLACFAKEQKTYSDLVAIRKIFIESQSLHYSLRKVKSLLSDAQKSFSRLEIKEPYRHHIWRSLLSPFKDIAGIARSHGILFQI